MGISLTLAIKGVSYTFLFDLENKLCDIKLVGSFRNTILTRASILPISKIHLSRFHQLIPLNYFANVQH